MEPKPAFQVVPPLSPEDYESLKEDIKKYGVQVAVEYDEIGNILDGHHRVKACSELGIKTWPSIVRIGLSEAEKFNHALRLNLQRRHLLPDQRKALWIEMRQAGMTYRDIADADGTAGKSTIQREVEKVVVPNGTTQLPNNIKGKDGKKYPAKKKRRKKSTYGKSKAQADSKAKKIISQEEKKIYEAVQPQPVLTHIEIRHCSMQELFSSGIKIE